MSKLKHYFPLLILAIFVVSGCGGDSLNMAEVKGKVLLDGQPLTAGSVRFIPDNTKGTEGPPSEGTINEQGEFTLIGAGGVEGAIIGFHKVTVTVPSAEPVGSTPDGTPPPATPPASVTIPNRYADFTTTDLTFEVKDQSNEATLNLTSQ